MVTYVYTHNSLPSQNETPQKPKQTYTPNTFKYNDLLQHYQHLWVRRQKLKIATCQAVSGPTHPITSQVRVKNCAVLTGQYCVTTYDRLSDILIPA